MQKTLSFNLNDVQEKEIFEYLQTIGSLSPNSNEYVKWSVKGPDWTGLMYTSAKFVLQTSNESFGLDIEGRLLQKESFRPHIGSDEVGKGDYFGPLVVCACYINSSNFAKVSKFGIMDSKKLSDEKIRIIAEKLIGLVDYEEKIVSPKEYNELTKKFKNVSIILAKSHREVVEKLLKKVNGEAEFVAIDQFSKSKKRLEDEFDLDIPLKQYHHAESDITVAAGSIIARYFFLLEFEKMNEEYGLKFPLGATHVIGFGKSFVKKYGLKELEKVAKVSFKTTQKIMNSQGTFSF